MGVISRLARFAAVRPPVFVVTAPGGTAVRLAVEAVLRERGWRSVASPAACSVLVVCGRPGPDLEQAIDRVWNEVPPPRARIRAVAPEREHLLPLLEQAEHELADLRRHRVLRAEENLAEEQGGHQEFGHEHHDGHGKSGHGHHGGKVAGLDMAGQGADRDGLKLDVLHVQLGPVLADWPTGLVVRTEMQGDVVQRAEVETCAGVGGGSFWTEPWAAARDGEPVARGAAERRRAARCLDTLGRLLSVAGWPRAAGQARWLRDDLLADHPPERLAPRFAQLSDSVLRSRTLRWMLRDLGPIDAASALLVGDAADRLYALLVEARTAMDLLGDPTPLDPADEARGVPGAVPVSLLPGLLAGADLGAARLIVASLDPDLDRPAAVAVHA
ncbi:hypothetical protein [Actinocorallia libanotica]|uniref:Uncharacterized protein n=1 Tax=Actinocorallia libanotica TaxID=46162 RepID=A0ABP4C2W9_9ACTN